MSDWLDRIYCEDALQGLAHIPDGAIDLLVADPPYGLGKDYGLDLSHEAPICQKDPSGNFTTSLPDPPAK